MFLTVTALPMLTGCADDDGQVTVQTDIGYAASVLPAELSVDNRPVQAGRQETDMDRLSRIQDRLRKVGLAEHAVIFGGEEQNNDSMVAIDYALFDQLSDDAVACMVAEAMLRQKSLRKVPQLPSSPLISELSESDISDIDFKAGLYLARAGFSSAGFTEWLEAEKHLPVPEGTMLQITDSQRSIWFMNGYRRFKAEG